MTQMIGRGEKVAHILLEKIFPEATIHEQVHVGRLFNRDLRKELSSRQQKETVDLVVYRDNRRPMVIRIQDKRHLSKYMSNVDNAQQTYLEWSNCDVVNVPEHECPILFKDKINSASEEELLKYIEPYM